MLLAREDVNQCHSFNNENTELCIDMHIAELERHSFPYPTLGKRLP